MRRENFPEVSKWEGSLLVIPVICCLRDSFPPLQVVTPNYKRAADTLCLKKSTAFWRVSICPKTGTASIPNRFAAPATSVLCRSFRGWVRGVCIAVLCEGVITGLSLRASAKVAPGPNLAPRRCVRSVASYRRECRSNP
jgi:hypothetical protein